VAEVRETNSASQPIVDLAAVMLGGTGWLMVLQMPIWLLLLLFHPSEDLSQEQFAQVIAVRIVAAAGMIGSARAFARRRPIGMPLLAVAWLACGSLVLLVAASATDPELFPLPWAIWGGIMSALGAGTLVTSIQQRRRRSRQAAPR
jgi:hypothetical protein